MKTTVLIYFVGAATVKVFGIFDPDYFSYNAAIYGLSGSIAYSLVVVLRKFVQLAKEEKGAKPFNRYDILLLFLRPVASTLLSFLGGGAVKLFFTTESILAGEGGQFVMGMVCGFFIEYLIKTEFQDAIFDKYINKKIK